MRVAASDVEQLIGATVQVSATLTDLLTYLRTADRLLESGAGRIGPALIGGLGSAAAAVRRADHRRARAAASLTDGNDTAEVTLALMAAADAPWVDGLLTVTGRLHQQINEVDRLAASLRRRAAAPVAVAPTQVEAQQARRLLHDVLEQELKELVPPALREFLPIGPPPRHL
ncbi:MAG: hypothetical protein R3320_02305 [Nitriliruptorales bacterium]|nr:hypothetical protein [Nitriliruptorales bacterium]